MAVLQPVKLLPACKNNLWGGVKLREQFGIQTDVDPLAEAWVLSAHPDGESVVVGGEYDGLPFSQYLKAAGDVCGKNVAQFEKFPMLIKFIDAKQPLSLQVHPDDRYAARTAGESGKVEMWYILSAEEGAYLYNGFSRPVTENEVRTRIDDGTLDQLLRAVPVKAGDMFFVSPGTVHAIGAGIVICEIQQSSDTTYRLYDYDRRDKDGNRRELHVDKALAVSHLIPTPLKTPAPEGYLASCRYFAVRVRAVDGEYTDILTDATYTSLVAVDGEGSFDVGGETYPLKKGDSYFIPAGDGTLTVRGKVNILLSTIPEV